MAKTEENMGSLSSRDDKLGKSLLENTEADCWIYANKMKLVEIKGNFKNLETVMSPLSQWSKRVFTLLLSSAFLGQRER